MKITEMRKLMADELRELYPEREISHLWEQLSDWATGLDRIKLALEPDRELTRREFEKLQLGLEALKRFEPVQYITGKAWFYGYELQVSKDVLIPRPETEELVHWILEEHKDRMGLKVLDIGTGSGCIAIALGKKLDHPSITATDVSQAALEIAGKNINLHGLSVHQLAVDILDRSLWTESGRYDIIVSNPPYVRISEKKDMLPNVLNYEPAHALFVDDDDPLVFYRAIGEFARNNLSDHGCLYLEINENLGKDTLQLMRGIGFLVAEVKRDMQGKERMLKASGLPS